VLRCLCRQRDRGRERGVQAADQWGKIGIITGGINGTYLRIAIDLANVLDHGDDLRVLAIMGKGSVQNIDDILYLEGIDIGIVQSDVLAFSKRRNKHPKIAEHIHYITKLYTEAFHLLVDKSIKTIEDLAGPSLSSTGEVVK
jgi:TRAP-type uncharacterized transport system substrate-binding protein